MTLGQQLRAYRKAKGYSQEDVAKHLGYKSFTTIQKWESDDSTPPFAILKKLAIYLDIDTQQLINPTPKSTMVPIVGVVAGGAPIDAIENWIGEYEVDSLDANHDYFYLRVKGDSMIGARIFDGDDVFVVKQPSVVNGEIAVVLIDQEATLKRVFYKDEQLILKPENPAYQPLVFSKEDIEEKKIMIVGKVLHNRFTVK